MGHSVFFTAGLGHEKEKLHCVKCSPPAALQEYLVDGVNFVESTFRTAWLTYLTVQQPVTRVNVKTNEREYCLPLTVTTLIAIRVGNVRAKWSLYLLGDPSSIPITFSRPTGH